MEVSSGVEWYSSPDSQVRIESLNSPLTTEKFELSSYALTTYYLLSYFLLRPTSYLLLTTFRAYWMGGGWVERDLRRNHLLMIAFSTGSNPHILDP